MPRLVGVARAKDLIFSGRAVRAEEALAMGLVDRVLAPEDVFEEAVGAAERYARGPALALAAAKRAVHNGLDMDLAAGLAAERLAFSALFATEDQRIGMTSFVERGPGRASFVGR